MRRALLATAALALGAAGTFGVGTAHASPGTYTDSLSSVSSSTNDLLSKIPGFGGPNTRHICVIDDQLDYYYCVFIPLP